MKMIIVLGLTFIVSFASKAQTVNDIPIKDIDVEYIQIIGIPKVFVSTNVFVEIDFGQNTKLVSSGKATIIKDKSGKVVEFNSMIDALNFMSSNGFELVTAYAATTGTTRSEHHYLLRNKNAKLKK